jgi:hypothetical protein
VGVALNGTALSMDTRGNRAFYDRKDVLPSDIMSGAATSDSQNIGRFLAALARSTGETAETAVADAPVDAVAVPQPATGATPANEVRTFPMEDPSPGGEPPQ